MPRHRDSGTRMQVFSCSVSTFAFADTATLVTPGVTPKASNAFALGADIRFWAVCSVNNLWPFSRVDAESTTTNVPNRTRAVTLNERMVSRSSEKNDALALHWHTDAHFTRQTPPAAHRDATSAPRSEPGAEDTPRSKASNHRPASLAWWCHRPVDSSPPQVQRPSINPRSC